MSSTSNTLPLRARLTRILTASPEETGPPVGLRQRMAHSGRIRRVEFLPMGLTVLFVPLLVGAREWADVLSWQTAAAAVLVVLGIQIGNMVNCLADRWEDQEYKPGQADAVRGLGVPNVVRQIVATGIVIAVVATWLVVSSGHYDLLLIGLLGGLLGVQYSLPPLHLKSRGIWQIPTLFAVLLFVPGLGILRAADRPWDWSAVIELAGYALAMAGVIVVNTAEDLPEDEKYGIRTFVVALGLSRAIAAALGSVVLGAVTVVATVTARSGMTWGFLPFALAAALAGGYLWRIRAVTRGLPRDAMVTALRPAAKAVPAVLAVLGWGTVVLALFVLADW
ncbi:1,4-dihydroxy-2-naphthoate octaprenyltransferase [Nocardia tenerifensis]|uniref:1,4-dihydroxy-2-naphthoate octaprenyltransferase n=1 Tax=Nocardia tenerifensis TaxID=228006 RepID=A0A318KFG2_9NOCA|nr:UbiA family prenyltransferase [Nocardia tenerifensis]PXX71705.1 1,4-dihydroxy-2-naphthoate octaprenyltransferase [Nocardia tenerifensis]